MFTESGFGSDDHVHLVGAVIAVILQMGFERSCRTAIGDELKIQYIAPLFQCAIPGHLLFTCVSLQVHAGRNANGECHML